MPESKYKNKAFAEGLRLFFTKGALVQPNVRITIKARILLKEHMDSDLDNTSVLFNDDDETYDLFMQAMEWLRDVALHKKNITPTKEVARTVHFWLSDKLRYDESEPACRLSQWIGNKINKHYSNSDLAF